MIESAVLMLRRSWFINGVERPLKFSAVAAWMEARTIFAKLTEFVVGLRASGAGGIRMDNGANFLGRVAQALELLPTT